MPEKKQLKTTDGMFPGFPVDPSNCRSEHLQEQHDHRRFYTGPVRREGRRGGAENTSLSGSVSEELPYNSLLCECEKISHLHFRSFLACREAMPSGTG